MFTSGEARLRFLKDNVQKMRLKGKHLDNRQKGWDDAVCVVLDLIDIYLKGAQEDVY